MNDKPTDIEQLLPWVANGTLSEEEQAEVDEYLDAHPDLRQELAFLQSLRKGVRAQQISSPGAFGLKRLQDAIRDEKQTVIKTRRSRAAANDNSWWKPSLAAAAVVIMVQGGFLIGTFTDKESGLQPLGVEQGTGLVLQIEFQPDATENQIRKLLETVNGRFIDGPSALGIYRVELSKGPLQAEEIDKLISDLRAASGVVRYVESN